MTTQKALLKKFADAPFVAKTKIWTPDRNSAEVDGPYDDVAGHLLLMVASLSHPKGKDRKAMRECLEVLTRKR